MLPFTSILRWNNVASNWTSITTVLTDLTDTAVNGIANASDKLYFGLDRQFSGIYFDQAASGTYTAVIVQFWDGSAWTTLPLHIAFDFARARGGCIRWRIPTGWTTRILTGVEATNTNLPTDDATGGTLKYWVRISVSTATATATFNRALPFPEYSYTTPDRVARFMQLPSTFFTSTSTPSTATIIDFIRRAEDHVDKYTLRSWKPNYTLRDPDQELYEFSRYGFGLKHYPILKVFDVAIWQGGSYESRTFGRDQDWFAQLDTGMVYFTRLFALPLPYTGTLVRSWGFGEFKDAVRVLYCWGADIDFDVDSYGSMVEKITNQIAAVDLIRAHDYSVFTTQGTDKVSLERKADIWDVDSQKHLDEMRRIKIWTP